MKLILLIIGYVENRITEKDVISYAIIKRGGIKFFSYRILFKNL
jgi:hypothetical protein